MHSSAVRTGGRRYTHEPRVDGASGGGSYSPPRSAPTTAPSTSYSYDSAFGHRWTSPTEPSHWWSYTPPQPSSALHAATASASVGYAP